MDEFALVELIREGLGTQAFTDWYEDVFIPFIEGGDDAVSKTELNRQISDIFGIGPTRGKPDLRG